MTDILSLDYIVDAEGVHPEAKVTLIENEIFHPMLNDRVPKINVSTFTDSARWSNPAILMQSSEDAPPTSSPGYKPLNKLRSDKKEKHFNQFIFLILKKEKKEMSQKLIYIQSRF